MNVIVFRLEHTAPFPSIHRVPSDTEVEGHQLGARLAENAPDERERLLAACVAQRLAPLATRANTIEGLRELVRDGACMIEPDVRKRLGLSALDS